MSSDRSRIDHRAVQRKCGSAPETGSSKLYYRIPCDKKTIMRYVGIGPERGREVEETAAFEYAANHLDDLPEEDKKDFVDWFFSGNWVKEDDEE